MVAPQKFCKHQDEINNELTILYRSTSIWLSFRQYYQFPVYTVGLPVTYFVQDMKCGPFLKIEGRALPVGEGAYVLYIITFGEKRPERSTTFHVP